VKGLKVILFKRIETEPVACESSGSNSESPQFFHYGQKLCHMMKRMGYDISKKLGFNFGEGKCALLRSFVPKGKDHDYYHKTRRGLSYVSMPLSSDPRSEKEICHDSSSAISSWDSDVSIDDIFKRLSVNMVSTSHLEDDKEDTFESEELIQSDSDP